MCSGLAQQTDEGGEDREREDHSLFSQCGQRRDPLTVWGWRAGAGMKGCGDGGPAAELGCPSFPRMNSPHTHKQTNSAGQASPPLPVRVVL